MDHTRKGCQKSALQKTIDDDDDMCVCFLTTRTVLIIHLKLSATELHGGGTLTTAVTYKNTVDSWVWLQQVSEHHKIWGSRFWMPQSLSINQYAH